MARSNKQSVACAKSKRKKGVIDLAEKLKILDLLKQGEKIVAIAGRFNVNKSIIHSKLFVVTMEKMEDMLIIWIRNMIHLLQVKDGLKNLRTDFFCTMYHFWEKRQQRTSRQLKNLFQN